jgi:hypothetical protein
MDDKEFIGLIADRYGLSLGAELARREVMRAVREHKNTERIKQLKAKIGRYETDLMDEDDTQEIREKKRSEKKKLEEQLYNLRKERREETEEERNKLHRLNIVVKYYDKAKVEPELENRGLLKRIPTIEDKVFEEAKKFVSELKKK